MSEDEFERRLPVWQALSDLFLDTELQPEAYRRIADDLRQTPFSTDEIRCMLESEVAPAFGPNLMAVAGQWALWTEEDVRRIMRRSLREPAFYRRLKAWMFRKSVAEEWAKLGPLLER